ncbi:MAG: dihydrolipoyl dehydrogenase [Alphaproteobacteria bacterium]|nr:MAG: dihydrolipoyl dehydrogenase [Alphaproteobacteria bacterium]
MTETAFDLVVVGGGPGGYVAAIRAAQLGMRTALVERQHLGGICLNWGCIPTKALLRSAEIIHLAREGQTFGFKIKGVEPDLQAMVKHSRKVAAQLNAGVRTLLKKNRVETVMGTARLVARDAVRVETAEHGSRTLKAKNIILATGARARELPDLKADGKRIWTYREAMVPEALPKSLIVVGSGAIGSEFASFYADLGVKVTLVEVLDRILPVEDAEVSAFVAKAFAKRGIEILTGASVEQAKAVGDGLELVIAKKEDGTRETRRFDRMILAVGITGNVENLGLEELGIRIDRGHVVVDEWAETNVPGIYAIGDLAGPPWLAHKASHEGVIAVERIAGLEGLHPLKPERIPGCTFTRPQVASIGLTEAAAIAAGHEIRVGRFPFIGNGKAIAIGEPEGFVKTIFEKSTGRLLGAHMVGAEVTEMIQGFAIAMELETTEAELMHTVFPHPTVSEAMHESVLAAFGRAIHI